MEIPFLGVPGTVHFINARTRWFDDGVQAALDAGIKQVRTPCPMHPTWCRRHPVALVLGDQQLQYKGTAASFDSSTLPCCLLCAARQ